MRVYFITRFSIYDPNFGGFRITRDNTPVEYEKRLFNKVRLDFKFETFQKITFPSIVNQTASNWSWMIYTSDLLPSEYMEKLHTMIKGYNNIKVITVKNFKEFFEKTSSFNYEKPFATVRIDDDDALNRYFVEKLQKYSDKVGSIVSFPQGRLAKYVHGSLVLGKRISEGNNAQGLSGIGMNIYNCGRHSDINERYNVIYDNSPDMFILLCSPFTDTKRGFSILERNIGRINQLIKLMLYHPNEIPKAIAAFIKKRMKP